jgi:hypothetical protein
MHVWWHTAIILALKRQRQVDLEVGKSEVQDQPEPKSETLSQNRGGKEGRERGRVRGKRRNIGGIDKPCIGRNQRVEQKVAGRRNRAVELLWTPCDL